eukprot:13040-Heterococcus_DN1.PRE.2
MQAFGRSASPLESTHIELTVKLARQSLLRAPERSVAELENIVVPSPGSAQDLQPATTCTITVSSPYQISGIRTALAERTGIQLSDIVLVSQGKAQRDSDVLPRACYAECIQELDPEDTDGTLFEGESLTLWLIDMSDEPESAVTSTARDDVPTASSHPLGSSRSFFGSALMVTVKQPSIAVSESAANSSDESSNDDAAAWDATTDQTAALTDGASAVPTEIAAADEQQLQLEIARSIEHFDIVEVLQGIDCKQYAELFIQAGYSQRGAFAAVTDADLAGDPLYIHVSARKRILALAASTARAIELEYGCVKTVLQEVAANADKFTMDGVTYYTTNREMMAAVAQQQSGGTSSIVTAAARRRKDSSSSNSKGALTKTVTAEQRALVNSIIAAEQQPAVRPSSGHAHTEGCCSKHNYAREQCWPSIIAAWLKNAMFSVDASLRAADSSGTGFVPRHELLSIVQQTLESNDLAYHETEAHGILQAAALPQQSPYLYDLGKFKRCLQAALSRGLHVRSGLPPPAAALTASAQ